MSTQRCVVIFDLDGTLTRHDSYLAYLAGFLFRHPRRLTRLLPLPWTVLNFALRRVSNTELKQRFLHAVLAGASKRDVESWTQRFVEQFMINGLRRDALDMLEHYRQRGDRLVLLTASLDLYVHEIGRRLGFDQVFCTQAEWVNDHLSGKLAGPNYRGDEKVRCLLRLRREHAGTMVIAYADHHSDMPFLRLADQGTLVNGTSKALRLAEREGLPCAIWKP
ncbi:MAG TPA: HAD-IB family hydrolase [Nitrospiraceae bacterium]|nr:HAD-IB family hydrolase [Nitrospiraceae bacterium]